MEFAAEPDVVIPHKPTQCEHCGKQLDLILPYATGFTKIANRRNEFDLPPMKIYVTQSIRFRMGMNLTLASVQRGTHEIALFSPKPFRKAYASV